MKKTVFLPCLMLWAIACDEAPEPANPPNLRALSSAEVRVSQATNDFGFRLLQEIQKKAPGNTFISPLSVSMALSMLLNGADGEVRQSILNTIEMGDLTTAEVNQACLELTELLLTMDRKAELGIANSVWHHTPYPVHGNFASIIRSYYLGDVTGADFSDAATKDRINGWVEDKTNGRIRDLIGSINPDDILFLVNAIYFKGEWTYQFDPSKTRPAPFRNLDGTTEEVNMMLSKGATVRYFDNGELVVLDIPYGNEQFSFTIIMPRLPGDLASTAAALSGAKLDEWLAESDSATLEIELPKFKLEWKDDLKATLAGLGMMMGGFPAMFKEPMPVQVSRVIHQTFLEVNEKGSEAAAATAIAIELTSVGPRQPLRVTVDRPFLFLIREKHSRVILFMGQLVDGAGAR